MPTAITKRILLLSSDEQAFHKTAPIYQSGIRETDSEKHIFISQIASTAQHHPEDQLLLYAKYQAHQILNLAARRESQEVDVTIAKIVFKLF